ncbi:MAG: type IX secretion system sortase PorU [Flavobacteriaceae bacterium]|nr:type IX secretion system sortase PorU [Flavobacteriaceae bacterium]
MRLMTLFFLPICLWSQQIDVQWDWQGAEQIHVGDMIQKVPKAIDQTVFYDEEHQRFALRISKQLGNNPNLQYAIKDVQTQEVHSDLKFDLDLDQFAARPHTLIYKTKGRDVHQLVFQIEPFIVKNNKLHVVTGFSVTPHAVKQLSAQRVQQLTSIESMPPQSGYRFEVNQTGIHKITAAFLRDLGMPVSSINPETLKIFGRGGKMLSLINSETEGVNYGFSENPLQLVGMNDGSIDDGDYILFYAYGSGEWNNDSQTSVNLYHDQAHYLITYGGENGLRVNVQPSAASIDDPQTSASVSLHIEEDLVNIAQMGRKWFGDRFLHNSSENYPFQLTNRKAATTVAVKLAAAASAENGSRFDLSLENENTSLRIAPTQTTTRAAEGAVTLLSTPSSNAVDVVLQYDASGFSSAVGFLDYIRLTYERTLSGDRGQFGFITTNSNDYHASDVDAIWELLPNDTIQVFESNSNREVYFTSNENADRYHVYSADDVYSPKRSEYGDTFTSPQLRERLSNEAEYIIITHDDFVEEANKLAAHHRTHTGLKSSVLSLSEIYDDFSVGNIDIMAIRNAIRYAYLNNSDDNKPKYVCLFGDTSYDYKDRVPNNNMIVPTYHALNSFHLANSYMSDDFYAMMDFNEGELSFYDRMDLAVGRILFDTKEGALAMVNKSINYSLTNGDWQNTFTILSDDPDEEWESIIQERLDELGEEVVANKPFLNLQKVHSDAFKQVISASGDRYPGVNQALENQFIQGTLAINYFGHGGESGLASEKIFDKELANRLYNPGRFPLFITSTCEFSRFDNPDVFTAGEASFANPAGGVIGLLSTTRQIYVSNGISYNDIMAKHLFAYGLDDYPTISEALRLSKNQFIGTAQKRIIFFIGDPALKLAIPQGRVDLTHLNGNELEGLDDENKQLRALDRVNLAGQVSNKNGELLNDFSGEVVLTIFDKELEKTTLGNDGNGTFAFSALGNVVFKGNAEVNNGFWNIELVIPKDISLPLGKARISMYAVSNDKTSKKTGLFNDVFIGGVNPNLEIDTQGPLIELFLDDESFENGDMTGINPILIARFSDENGINTSGGLGHELLAVLDGMTQNPIVLNNFYRTNLGDYQSGSLNYLFNNLSPGPHTLSVTAWDAHNNPSTQSIDFVVSDKNNILIGAIYNIPNPFETQTTFWVSHNKPRELIEANIIVHDINGKKVWEQNKILYSGTNTNSEIVWNGQSNDGTIVNKGLYLCTITLNSTLSNTTDTETHRIIIN